MFRLRDFRTDLGLTQKEIMTTLNVSQTTISFVENGQRNLTKEQMAILVSKYGEETVSKYLVEPPTITDFDNIQGNITPPAEAARDTTGLYQSLIDIISRQQSQMDSLLESNTLMQRRIDKLLAIIEKQYQL